MSDSYKMDQLLSDKWVKHDSKKEMWKEDNRNMLSKTTTKKNRTEAEGFNYTHAPLFHWVQVGFHTSTTGPFACFVWKGFMPR